MTCRQDESDKILALELGAGDYITKPFSPKELIARINAVLRWRMGELGLEEDIVELDGLRLNKTSRIVTTSKFNVEIGPTECRLLHFLMRHPERVYSRLQLRAAVWGEDTELGERTIDVHVRRLRQSLGKIGCNHRLQTVHGLGYQLSRPKTLVPCD